MSEEPVDFLDQDPYDPELVAAYEQNLADGIAQQNAPVEDMLKRRREAYVRMWTPGAATQADIDIVNADLMWFCKVRTTTYDIRDGIHAERLSHMKDGRREVFHRIEDHARLSHEALLLMYTNAITQ